jgi:hypothetical protein
MFCMAFPPLLFAGTRDLAISKIAPALPNHSLLANHGATAAKINDVVAKAGRKDGAKGPPLRACGLGGAIGHARGARVRF